MKNLFFPTTIIDGFFEEPDKVREFALSLDYNDVSDYYPGKRTKFIHEIDNLFFKVTCTKLLQSFYNDFGNDNYINFNASMIFQKINGRYNTGWIHKDNEILTCIIYLNPDVGNLRTGTSLYDKKNFLKDPLLDDSLISLKKQGINKIKNENICNDKNYLNDLTKFNSEYEESLFVRGKYNRAFLFDSHFFHAGENFYGEDECEERLTLVTFFYNISSSSNIYPIQRIHKSSLTDI